MSLKTKIEAIVYAAEEPVTVEQIAATLAAAGLDGDPNPPEAHSPGDTLNLEAPGIQEESLQEVNSQEEGLREKEQPHDVGGPPNENEPREDARASPEPSSSLDAPPPNDEKGRAKAIKQTVRRVLDELIAEYSRDDRAIEIRLVAGGYRMATKPEHHDVVRAFVKGLKPPMRLSLQSLETLAVIAYKQPVTAPEINEIRGVDSAGVLGSLISRKLITTAGRKQVVGRPILYKTSRDFLLRFGLKDLSELPNMEEFEKLALESGDLFRRETTLDVTNGPESAEVPAAADPTNEPGEDNHSNAGSGGPAL